MKKEQNAERSVSQKKEKHKVVVTGDSHGRGCACRTDK
jgi:CO dehydrogenase nickel-insertion accessory protein CooC1